MAEAPRLVMVHGIFDTGRVFNAMRRDFEARGILCLNPTLKPWGAPHGLEPLAQQLAQAIDQAFGASQPINLLGFSMGTVVSRYYLQTLGGHRRTQRFFALSGPFQGSQWARLCWWRGAQQLRPGSEFLKALEADTKCLEGMALHSYWTPLDLMIIPPTSSRWPRAENHRIWSLCHPCMLHNRRVREHIYQTMVDGELTCHHP